MYEINVNQIGAIASYLKQVGIQFKNDKDIENVILYFKYYCQTTTASNFETVINGINIMSDKCIINSNAKTILDNFSNNYLKKLISLKSSHGLVGICGGFPVYHKDIDWSTWTTSMLVTFIDLSYFHPILAPTESDVLNFFGLLKVKYEKFASNYTHLKLMSLDKKVFDFKESQTLQIYRNSFSGSKNFGLFFIQGSNDVTNEYPYGAQYICTKSGSNVTGSGSRAKLYEIIPIIEGSINTTNVTTEESNIVTNIPKNSSDLYDNVLYSDIVHSETIAFKNLDGDKGGLTIEGLPKKNKSDAPFYYYLNGGDM